VNSSNDCRNDINDDGFGNVIQTEVSSIEINSGLIEKSPGENVEINLRATDEQNISTIAFLQIGIDDEAELPLVSVKEMHTELYIVFTVYYTQRGSPTMNLVIFCNLWSIYYNETNAIKL